MAVGRKFTKWISNTIANIVLFLQLLLDLIKVIYTSSKELCFGWFVILLAKFLNEHFMKDTSNGPREQLFVFLFY